jgi:3-(3-hydroxy-phenyl)propionate hydroxylase
LLKTGVNMTDVSTPADSQVLVVGAGPVGLTAALAGRRRGLSVTVLEAEPEGRERPGSRAIFVHRETLEHLEKLVPGLGRTVGDEGVQWLGKRTFWGDREVFARTYPPPRPGTLPHSTNLSQLRTEDLLLDACRARGVRIRWGFRVEGLDIGPGGVTLRAEDGRTCSAPYVIGADGARSTVREALGIPLEGARSEASFVIVDVEETADAPLPLERRYHYSHPAVGRRNVLLLPFAGGWRADLQCLPNDDPSQFNGPEGASRWIARVLPAQYADRIRWVSTYQFRQAVARDFVDPSGRVLLVGEAAHLFAPFGARGMNSGVADAVAAAEAIDAALGQPEPMPGPAGPVREFGLRRRQAAEKNREAAGLALDHMLARDRRTRLRRRAAAELARVWERPGEWLDTAPYGPRRASAAGGRY